MFKKIASFLMSVSIVGLIIAMVKLVNESASKIESKEKTINKFKQYYNLYGYWIELKNKNIHLETYFKERGFKSIAIYGMGDVGMQFAMELENSSIQVKYVLDENVYSDRVIFDVKNIEDANLPEVDAVVVTPVFAYDKIQQQIKSKFHCPIISIEDVVYSL